MPAPSRKRSEPSSSGAAARPRAEERALQVGEHGRARLAARRQLLDPPLGEAREVVGRARERGEGVPAGLVRQRDRHLGARGERLEQRPLGAGQVLEAVREHRPRLPGAEVAGGALGRVAALELAVPEPEPVELLAVGAVERGELALQLAGLEQRGLELGDGRAERIGEARRSARERPSAPATTRRSSSVRCAWLITGRCEPLPCAIRSKRSSKVPIEPPTSAPARVSSSRSARSTSGRFGTIRIGSESSASR